MSGFILILSVLQSIEPILVTIYQQTSLHICSPPYYFKDNISRTLAYMTVPFLQTDKSELSCIFLEVCVTANLKTTG